ncbi:ADP-ribosylglycohydrolase [Thermanaerovibrio velox DSM 12556]|uniref:ADP-ribosylglycohydrolase n=1 Tax=Thermanaerovibrio velox DSM 12556 TaxID=926567 RepID=H0UQM3_9BACT|nr:ADP-ribosylglycohydrolase family protein [Thermanaerovibrio velox]EHM10787.1 ADP-ribosylglycohydrolase [Thermanaerovibrio velox DSM 12556]
MLGAIIGDIVGSRFERTGHKGRDFELFHPRCRFTDDTVMTLAVAKAILVSRGIVSLVGDNAVRCMRELGRLYPDRGYGSMFARWLSSPEPAPYGSRGNGAAMRVSPCGFAARGLEEARELAFEVTRVTHDHPEAIKGAEAVASAVFLARSGASLEDMRRHVQDNYYPTGFTLDEIREGYSFSSACEDTVPQALQAFFESRSFEEAVRNAVSLGGDTDTLGAVAGSVAEAFYGIPRALRDQAMAFLDERLRGILGEFEAQYPPSIT